MSLGWRSMRGDVKANRLTTRTAIGDDSLVTGGLRITGSLLVDTDTESEHLTIPRSGGGSTGELLFQGGTWNMIRWPAAGVAAPAFTTRSVGTRLVIYPNIGGATVDYALGISSSSLWYSVPDASAVHRWFIGTTDVLDLASAGLVIAGNRYFGFSSWGGGWYMSDSTWIRALNDKNTWLGAGWYGCDGGLSLGWGGVTSGTYRLYVNGNGYCAAAINAGGNMDAVGQVACHRNGGSAGSGATSNLYTDASFFANPAGTYGVSTASIAFHPSGVAPQLRCGANDANIYNRAFDGTTNNPFTASAFTVASSRRIKRNIVDWPRRGAGAGTEPASAVLARLRTITFERDEPGTLKEVPSGRRSQAYGRLVRHQVAKGRELYELPEHDCAVHDCVGTHPVDDPCHRILNARLPEFGLIAEEVAEVLPEAVVLDVERKPAGINYHMLDVITIAAVQELTERIAALEAQLASAHD